MESHFKLSKKGWTEQEIHRTLDTLNAGEQKKSLFVKKLDTFVLWLFLIISILGIFAISIALVPILVIMEGAQLFILLAGMGAVFGVLLDSIIVHLQKLRQLIISRIFLPVFALINVYLITRFSNDLIEMLKLPTLHHSPTLVSITYVAAFLVPHIIRGLNTKSIQCKTQVAALS